MIFTIVNYMEHQEALAILQLGTFHSSESILRICGNTQLLGQASLGFQAQKYVNENCAKMLVHWVLSDGYKITQEKFQHHRVEYV